MANYDKDKTSQTKPSSELPMVIPLIAADDIEVAIRSKATETAQQIALALSGMLRNAGVSGASNLVNQSLKAIQNQDLSSTLTVATENGNTLYFRIAPNNEASGSPSLVGQTYDIALLLLVPKSSDTNSTNDDNQAGNVSHGESRGPNMTMVSFTQFRQASNGTLLSPRSPYELTKNFRSVIRPYLEMIPTTEPNKSRSQGWFDDESWFDNQISNADTRWYEGGWFASEDEKRRWLAVSNLVGAVFTGRYAEFTAMLSCPSTWNKGTRSCPQIPQIPPEKFSLVDLSYMKHALWTAIATLHDDSQYKSTSFELPQPTPLTIPRQTALVLDDTQSSATVTLHGVKGSDPGALDIRLVITPPPRGKPTPAEQDVDLPATAIKLDTTLHTLTVTFPSPAQWDIIKASAETGSGGGSNPRAQLRFSLTSNASDAAPPTIGDQVLSLPASHPPQSGSTPEASLDAILHSKFKSGGSPTDFKVTSTVPDIVEIKGSSQGSIPIKVSKLPENENIELTSAPGLIRKVTDLTTRKPLTMTKDGTFSVTHNGTYDLLFNNLRPDTQTTVTAQGKSGGNDTGVQTLTFSVSPTK